MRKNPTRLRGTNFCTSLARLAHSFIRQPNGPECTQIVSNAPKRKFRFQWGGSCAFVVKIPTRLRGTNICTNSACFAPSFVRQPNGFKCTHIVWNAPKCQFSVLQGGSGAFLRKILTRLRGTNFCTSTARFAPCFVRQPNGPKCTQNSTKRSKTSV